MQKSQTISADVLLGAPCSISGEDAAKTHVAFTLCADISLRYCRISLSSLFSSPRASFPYKEKIREEKCTSNVRNKLV